MGSIISWAGLPSSGKGCRKGRRCLSRRNADRVDRDVAAVTKAVAELAVKGDRAEGSQSLYVEHNQSED
jgi:hypothetical protein